MVDRNDLREIIARIEGVNHFLAGIAYKGYMGKLSLEPREQQALDTCQQQLKDISDDLEDLTWLLGSKLTEEKNES